MRTNILNEIALVVNQEFNMEIDGEYNLFNISFGINRKVIIETLLYMCDMWGIFRNIFKYVRLPTHAHQGVCIVAYVMTYS